MGFLTEWVRTVFIMVAAVSFVEILLPGGSMGKYVKFILSLMILSAVLSPFSLIGKDQSIKLNSALPPYPTDSLKMSKDQSVKLDGEQRLKSEQGKQQDHLSSDSAMTAQLPVSADEDPLSAVQTKQIQQVYQDKLEQALKEQIFSKFSGIQTASVHIYMNNDVTKRSYGKIRKVVILLEPANLAQPVRSFAAETLSIGRRQIQVTDAAGSTGAASSTDAANQVGDTGG